MFFFILVHFVGKCVLSSSFESWTNFVGAQGRGRLPSFKYATSCYRDWYAVKARLRAENIKTTSSLWGIR